METTQVATTSRRTSSATPASSNPGASVQLKAGLAGQGYAAQTQMLAPRAPVQQRQSVQMEANMSMPDGSVSDGHSSSAPPNHTPADGGGANQSAPPAPPPPGSATVFGESGDTEYGFTNRGTPDVVAALQANPTLSVDQVLRLISATEYATNYTTDPDYPQPNIHASIAHYGSQPNNGQSGAGTKKGILIANAQYTNYAALTAVTAQATSLQGQLNGRGFTTNLVNNATSPTMATNYDGMVSAANAGDELVAFFTGHGSPQGLCGINDGAGTNDMYSHGQVSGLLSAATAKGAHIRFIIDACHSGAAASTVRQERVNQLATQNLAPTQAAWLLLAHSLMSFKADLVRHTEARHAALGQITAAITWCNANPQPNPQQQALVLGALQNAHTQVAAAWDAKIQQTWRQTVPFLQTVAFVLLLQGQETANPPVTVTDFARLGDNIQALDRLSNGAIAMASQPATAPAAAH